MRRISITVYSDKRPVGPPTDHFKRLLVEACQNHAYPVRHKLKYCSMMKSFMTSRSLTWGAELGEGPDGSDMTPFSEQNAVVMVDRGCPLIGEVPSV
jgi:hypothetical protein